MNSSVKVLVCVFLLIAFVIIGSIISVKMWSNSEEKIEVPENISIDRDMTLAQIAKQNEIPDPVMKKVFDVSKKEELQKKFSEFSLTVSEAENSLKKQIIFAAEEGAKDWKKILVKFVLWFIFLVLIFFLLRNNAIDSERRKWLYFVAVVIFGIFLGADPGPMGTVKDTIVLFGQVKIIFPPRLFAMTLFLITVVLANKFICSWGCQVGTLQDLNFRINRRKHEPIIPQFKLSFAFTNTVRIVFFIVFTAAAFIWAFDLVEEFDPFKIFKPATLAAYGIFFLGILFLLSIFVYRPWCHLFCPFGLLGWVLEKISIYKIKVNYRKCIACGNCAESCPSSVMEAILRRDRIIPDCFSCGTCVEVCPTNAISFDKGKRTKPPAGKFDEMNKK
ncbi:MAG: 4Fe-4S binding protein [Candidatus Cloacimonetes bacterium]|nr:4Fe-4S binding protein [Candidatus Cloacimonadota bacterium]MCF7812966.1 4Fe-4S binding protein [Candidatus Cloacimonadota bacterium]MCF7867302.1 4Fe-4S binding protein [Candidatus Cloacimonadota bacterium]MCF7882746.1 4Fe-4S binding protein [Candidatus Cloacimonadota bacterium]